MRKDLSNLNNAVLIVILALVAMTMLRGVEEVPITGEMQLMKPPKLLLKLLLLKRQSIKLKLPLLIQNQLLKPKVKLYLLLLLKLMLRKTPKLKKKKLSPSKNTVKLKRKLSLRFNSPNLFVKLVKIPRTPGRTAKSFAKMDTTLSFQSKPPQKKKRKPLRPTKTPLKLKPNPSLVEQKYPLNKSSASKLNL
jgi:hypothetical protein